MLDSHEVLAFSSCLLLVASPHVTKPWVHFFHQSDPKVCVSLGNDFVSVQRLSECPYQQTGPTLGTLLLFPVRKRHKPGVNLYILFPPLAEMCSLDIFSQVWSSGWQTLEKKWKGQDGRSYMAGKRNVAENGFNWWEEQASNQNVK